VEPVQKPLYALGLRLLATLVLSSLIMLVKLTSESGVALPEILFWRQVPSGVLIFAWLALRGETARLRTQRLPTHARRAMLGLSGMFFTFGAPILLPLAVATTFGFTTPIFAVILSALLLREKIGPVRWLAVVLGFTGVLIIAQPGHAAIPLFGAFVGIGAGFIPKNLDTALLDGVIQVDAEAAREYARRSAREEGLLVGISSGATLAAIAQKLPELPAGASVLGFNYDTGERYLSIEGFLPS
jgi:drug/metabolite transporter (DMT)-like permease